MLTCTECGCEASVLTSKAIGDLCDPCLSRYERNDLPPRAARLRLRESDCGVVHGRGAGRFTAHERGAGTWDVVFHPVRGADVVISQDHRTRGDAVNAGWKEYERRMQWCNR